MVDVHKSHRVQEKQVNHVLSLSRSVYTVPWKLAAGYLNFPL